MRLLFIGDIVGSPGRRVIDERLADILVQEQIDLAVANADNAAGGFGIIPRLAEELLALGIEVLCGGNHIWDRREILDYLPHQPRLLRPANFPGGVPGSGLFVGETRRGLPFAVLHVQGRTFMPAIDCPFRAADRELARLPETVKVILVDAHAEATSEKQALGWYLDGRVSAVVGTHTHVATADERILPGGTAFITDVGMTGPHNSVIGMDQKSVLERFLKGLPSRFEVAASGLAMHAVRIEINTETGRAESIERSVYRLD
ncbi:MAG TPA: TIGR00282 family metallophosphoesterase [Candidatus Dormibacteraeota bacterium]|nr:TIGR00282 family metallophosphoesterase [Candidatus Dormibacteraeota bacterium]